MKSYNKFRRRIIRPSDDEFKLGYQSAPLRQILSLKLSSLNKLILINFFSHNYDTWELSINGIANSLGCAKNRSSVSKALKELQELGYLHITPFTYQVDVAKINIDYRVCNINFEAFDDSFDGDVPDQDDSIDNNPLLRIIPVPDINVNQPLIDNISVPDSTSVTHLESTIPLINEIDKRILKNENNEKIKSKQNSINETPTEFPTELVTKPITEIIDKFDRMEQGNINFSSAFENNNSVKQHITSTTSTSKNINKQTGKKMFQHNGTPIQTYENFQLENDQFVFPTKENSITQYLLPEAFQVMANLFNKLINQDIVKYQKLPFTKFEILTLISLIDKLVTENKLIPSNQQELQSYYPMFNIDKFEEVLQHYKNNPEEYYERIEELNQKYSSWYNRPSE